LSEKKGGPDSDSGRYFSFTAKSAAKRGKKRNFYWELIYKMI